MHSNAKTISEYLMELPDERRKALKAVRQIILHNLPAGYEEVINYGMIGYVVPLKLYPDGYLGKKDVPLPFAGLASQKQHMSLYLNCIYQDKAGEKKFKDDWKKTKKKLDMGKSCIRFKSVDDLALPVIARAIKRVKVKDFVAAYESGRKKKKGTGSGQKTGTRITQKT